MPQSIDTDKLEVVRADVLRIVDYIDKYLSTPMIDSITPAECLCNVKQQANSVFDALGAILISEQLTEPDTDTKLSSKTEQIGYMIARTYSGGRDLFYGVPNLVGAKIISYDIEEKVDDYVTVLNILTANNKLFNLSIRQEK